MPSTIDKMWSARETTPADIEAALRGLMVDVHRANTSYVPARVMNLVCVVDKAYSGEIANRLRKVGRYHPSRTIVCAVEPGRETLDAVATIAAPAEVRAGEIGLLRETIVVTVGPKHVAHLDRIVDPLVVTDLNTAIWAPHGHDEAVDAMLSLAQVVLIDSVDDADARHGLQRARELEREAYVVDLAWLRSTPWRERVASTFDPPRLRADLGTLSLVCVRHHPESRAAALLLVGWLASRLGWKTSPLIARNGAVEGSAHGRRQDVHIRLELDPAQQVRGLAGLTLETATGRHLSLDRGPGGLRARYTHKRGTTREWTVLGASRGEAGILGEGIRQALLRDPTYEPALDAAETMLL